MSLLFGSLPVASRLFLGVWGFDGAAGIACLLMIFGVYFHVVSRRRFPTIPDPAAVLDRASQLAASGRTDPAIAVLTKAIHLNPQLWQAFQYRGELRVLQEDALALAIQDFSAAIGLAPQEPHLYLLRARAYSLLGDDSSSQRDYQKASALVSQAETPPQ